MRVSGHGRHIARPLRRSVSGRRPVWDGSVWGLQGAGKRGQAQVRARHENAEASELWSEPLSPVTHHDDTPTEYPHSHPFAARTTRGRALSEGPGSARAARQEAVSIRAIGSVDGEPGADGDANADPRARAEWHVDTESQGG
jgi:hypothetical protein